MCFDLQAFISEAENLLNPALSKLDFSEGVCYSFQVVALHTTCYLLKVDIPVVMNIIFQTTGHTPSVIGTQEVYRSVYPSISF